MLIPLCFRHAAYLVPLDLGSQICIRTLTQSSIVFARPPPALLAVESLQTQEHHALARSWLDGFTIKDIPREVIETSFVRSSGPGGQHVNKTNSKAVLKISLSNSNITSTWLPPFLLPPLQRTQYYNSNPNSRSLQITSQLSRSASQNLESAYSILQETIISAGRSVLVGETSEAQKARVRGLVNIEEKRRRVAKDRQKSKKASRRDE